jgi:hypothetical protein
VYSSIVISKSSNDSFIMLPICNEINEEVSDGNNLSPHLIRALKDYKYISLLMQE